MQKGCSKCGYIDKVYSLCDDCQAEQLCLKCSTSLAALCPSCVKKRHCIKEIRIIDPLQPIELVGFPKISYKCGGCGETNLMYGDKRNLCPVKNCPRMFICPHCKGNTCFEHSK